MLNTSSVIFLALFMLLSFYHLYVCFRLYEKPRRITKPLLMPLLLLFYLCFPRPDPLVMIALAASCVGDTLLIETNENRVKLGIAAFLICQVLYIAKWALSTDWAGATVAGILIPAAVYLAAGVLLFRYIRGKQGLAAMTVPVIIYLTTISVMSCMACVLMLTTGARPAALIFAGSLVFMVSDVTLATETFKAPFKHSNFLIMKTYLIAQTLIVLGIVLK